MSIEKQVREILARTGIGKQLAVEAESERVTRHEALRARKAAAIAKFLKDKPAADALVRAADQKAVDAQELAKVALNDYVKAREKLDTVHGTLSSVVDPVDKEMRTCCDPAIDAFKAELEAMRAECPNLQRVSDDGKTDNRAAINNALDAAERMKIDPTVDDVPAALAAILKSIPQA